MKILLVGPYPPAKDGIGDYAQALAGEFVRAGHEVRVLAVRGDGPVLPGEVFGTLDSVRAALSAARAWAPDVVHVQFAVAAFGTRIPALLRVLPALRALPAKLVVTLHEVTRDTATLGPLGRSLYRRVLRAADQVIVHTAAALRRLSALDHLGGTLVRHPVHRPAEVTSPADLRARFGLGADRVLLAFGFIHVDKGLDDTVRALAAAHRADPAALRGVRLVVAGRVRPRRGAFRVLEARDHLHLLRVRAAITRAGLDDRVVFTDYVPDADVAGWFRVAAAVLLPYRRIEQSGVAGLADAFGTPVLASDVGGLAEQFTGSPWLFPPRDPGAMADVLVRFLGTTDPHVGRTRAGEGPCLADVVARTLAVYRASAPARTGSGCAA
ncbi:glycosyltransferase [Actinokineospora auranticolor]|uniref:Glycosyltransferase involved in cell wall biosynthesis n=1 Tax=Actinokineospora auranticolor TaxID=155976 RepID=A0A2S6GQ02_9PSEU|nr:glycosyltransferase [Actinokineospora auranticolor]PPK67345.1 glycosyltransferase involved in cell wall biosynthesis [Actinokineospora auranticolor]